MQNSFIDKQYWSTPGFRSGNLTGSQGNVRGKLQARSGAWGAALRLRGGEDGRGPLGLRNRGQGRLLTIILYFLFFCCWGIYVFHQSTTPHCERSTVVRSSYPLPYHCWSAKDSSLENLSQDLPCGRKEHGRYIFSYARPRLAHFPEWGVTFLHVSSVHLFITSIYFSL